ncbi:hypothetical protein ADUPG1_009706, partial [Aduncisulcus paluster]
MPFLGISFCISAFSLFFNQSYYIVSYPSLPPFYISIFYDVFGLGWFQAACLSRSLWILHVIRNSRKNTAFNDTSVRNPPKPSPKSSVSSCSDAAVALHAVRESVPSIPSASNAIALQDVECGEYGECDPSRSSSRSCSCSPREGDD